MLVRLEPRIVRRFLVPLGIGALTVDLPLEAGCFHSCRVGGASCWGCAASASARKISSPRLAHRLESA